MEISCSKCGDKKTSGVRPIAETDYNLLSPHKESHEQELDFPIYPDPKEMFFQAFPFSTPPNFNMDASQDLYPASSAFPSNTMYFEAPKYPDPFATQSEYSDYHFHVHPTPSLTLGQTQSTISELGSEEHKEKGRCTYPDCGRVFKDLKAHLLTHQTERPERCPIQACEYHIKGFSRKYDKNRHTLTHYKGTMICGFCPSTGPTAEKSFNRADVFKRHLIGVHSAEQTPPNSRKKTPGSARNSKRLLNYDSDATGMCSTCSKVFGNAQDLYEHLDDCVLRKVQQIQFSDAMTGERLQEADKERIVDQTLPNNHLSTSTTSLSTNENANEDDKADEGNQKPSNTNDSNSLPKAQGLVHSKGQVTIATKPHEKRKDYPPWWDVPLSETRLQKEAPSGLDTSVIGRVDCMVLDTDYDSQLKVDEGNV